MTDPSTLSLVERLRAQAKRHRDAAIGLGSAALLEEAAEAIERTWLPIATAPTQCPVNRAFDPHCPVWTTETMWVKDSSGRVFEAWFVEVGEYWWDCAGETECKPVAWMPHPLWTPDEGRDDDVG